MKPKMLQPGDTIGVISPASPSYRNSDVIRGIETLKKWGYKVQLSKNLNKRKGFVAGTDLERAEDFNDMFARKDIDAIFITQGGYGSARMLKYIDFEAVRQNPKIFIGFSDITSLHLAILKKTGLITFHGPSMSRFNPEELTDYTRESLFRALAQPGPMGKIRLADEKKYIDLIYPGKAEGILTGGNLTLICATLGTPYEIETAGKILFLEELDTEPWIIDHMLTHLFNAGKLQETVGIVVGECINCRPNQHNPGYYVDLSTEDLFQEYLKPLKIPAIYGLPIGHTKDMATLPMGIRARLNADKKELEIMESAVESLSAEHAENHKTMENERKTTSKSKKENDR
ncbi:S66 peptidase family protein [Anoxynatronum buryatiense]|uniref:Muramoyltetrapeptide carboxypeptidase n=1 Tax=Anoxynatronum buryatiense TaxID=489973 RepID=A0AA46AJL6_9CLOT|nr:LD-carboxypeptidase [Anoxynatronum buryatiense]SMP62574.1 muramoyltetrapeptide carboxypeptidase [Anoxynatronum buryatiense]